jgi:hypothetical protein
MPCAIAALALTSSTNSDGSASAETSVAAGAQVTADSIGTPFKGGDMRPRFGSVIALAVAVGGPTATAQQQAPGGSPAVPPQQVTVTGCIERADQIARANTADVDNVGKRKGPR